MIHNTVNLCDFYTNLSDEGGKPMLTSYCRSISNEIDPDRKYPAILILPGGGYGFTSDREAEPIAIKYLDAGFNAFVLRYSIKPAQYPSSLLEAAAAVDYIRKHVAETATYPDMIAVIGFSAGGHLAGNLSCFWNQDFIATALQTTAENVKPNAAVLSYPVITDTDKGHIQSFNNLCGDNTALRQKLSLETAVTTQNPPTFVWHTVTDPVVPIENSLLYCNALQKEGVPFELHCFANGTHGLSTCGYHSANVSKGSSEMIEPAAEAWFDLSVTWLKRTFGMLW